MLVGVNELLCLWQRQFVVLYRHEKYGFVDIIELSHLQLDLLELNHQLKPDYLTLPTL